MTTCTACGKSFEGKAYPGARGQICHDCYLLPDPVPKRTLAGTLATVCLLGAFVPFLVTVSWTSTSSHNGLLTEATYFSPTSVGGGIAVIVLAVVALLLRFTAKERQPSFPLRLPLAVLLGTWHIVDGFDLTGRHVPAPNGTLERAGISPVTGAEEQWPESTPTVTSAAPTATTSSATTPPAGEASTSPAAIKLTGGEWLDQADLENLKTSTQKVVDGLQTSSVDAVLSVASERVRNDARTDVGQFLRNVAYTLGELEGSGTEWHVVAKDPNDPDTIGVQLDLRFNKTTASSELTFVKSENTWMLDNINVPIPDELKDEKTRSTRQSVVDALVEAYNTQKFGDFYAQLHYGIQEQKSLAVFTKEMQEVWQAAGPIARVPRTSITEDSDETATYGMTVEFEKGSGSLDLTFRYDVYWVLVGYSITRTQLTAVPLEAPDPNAP